jgi:hexosaminidase
MSARSYLGRCSRAASTARVSIPTVVLCLLSLSLVGPHAMTQENPSSQSVALIPMPASLATHEGSFRVNAETRFFLDDGGSGEVAEAQLLASVLARTAGWSDEIRTLRAGSTPASGILLRLSEADTSRLGPEGYTLEVTPTSLTLTAATRAGLFYGIETVVQLLPPASMDTTVSGEEVDIPCVSILDRPRFPYRGMHLDVSRHFFPVSFVKRYIDLLSLHKMNVFHWHLTDDNGWRIEIPRYPLLTQIGAWRVDRAGTTWREREPQQEGEIPTYGGYYTQDQIRDVVAYAQARHVLVIPEIEMPGHSSEVLAAYPHLSCTGGPFTVATGAYWPNVDIFCAGNDSVFVFLEEVLGEVMQLFPGPYIHIGGDEADKLRWRACPKCQARIRAEGLRDEEELQSYFIKRIEKIVTAGGKRLIGWDEILQGGLPPEATVMSWRGVEGGIDAARQGHDVIMTPVSHCYFDYYQADPEFEPEAIGGYTTLKEVYSFEPLPSELSSEEARHVLGAQGNLWTEYVPTPSHAEYMVLPRMAALAEVVWTPRARRGWEEFRKRLDVHLQRLDALGVTYSGGTFRPAFRTRARPDQGELDLVITSEQSSPLIRYTRDGTDPDENSPRYSGPIPLRESSWIAAALFEGATPAGRVVAKDVIVHDAVGSQVRYRTPYSDRFPSDSTFLVDGLKGSLDHTDGYWQAFLGSDIDLDIQLPRPVRAKRIVLSFLVIDGSRIFPPGEVSVEVSADGRTFSPVLDADVDTAEEEGPVRRLEFTFEPEGSASTAVIRVRATVDHTCPPGHPLEGMQTLLFVDEVIVES